MYWKNQVRGTLAARGYLGLFSFSFLREGLDDLACLLACFDTAENEPCKVCPLSAYRSPRWHEDEAAIDIGSKNWPEFRILLINKFGNLLRAWKFALDDDGNGRLSFYEFCNAVRNLVERLDIEPYSDYIQIISDYIR